MSWICHLTVTSVYPKDTILSGIAWRGEYGVLNWNLIPSCRAEQNIIGVLQAILATSTNISRSHSLLLLT